MANSNKANKVNKVFIVETPVENFCGIGAGGVQYAYGKAEVHDGWVANWYKEHGYKVTEKEAPKDNETSGDKS